MHTLPDKSPATTNQPTKMLNITISKQSPRANNNLITNSVMEKVYIIKVVGCGWKE